MCGRFALRAALAAWAKRYGAGERLNLPPRFNVAPTDPVAVIRRQDGVSPEGGQQLVLMRWGLVPHWSTEVPKSRPLINARAESIDQKPAFRDAFARSRCLVIADGFYEWQRQPDGTKQAYFMTRPSTEGADEVFAFAGLWSRWAGGGGEVVESCCIVTTVASESLAPIHHRMPVILDAAGEAAWLDTAAPADDLKGLLRPAEDISARPVSSYVNRVANDDAGCLRAPGEAPAEATQQYSLI